MEEVESPVFILGVPRSGTTLLRIILDSHPNIACGPEAPWLARGAHSLKNLYYYMADDKFGYVANYHVPREEMRYKFAHYVDDLFMAYAEKKGKSRWVEKTPDNSLDIPFLSELFPQARFVHLVRDGRDVACSTAILSEERKAISKWHAENILMGDGTIVENNIENSAKRWEVWNKKIASDLEKVQYKMMIRYEDLVTEPSDTLKQLMNFIGEQYDPSILDFSAIQHDLPDWEWGTHDMARTKKISSRSLERWKKQLTHKQIEVVESSIGETLHQYGYKLSPVGNFIAKDKSMISRKAKIASVTELKSIKFRWFMFKMNKFAQKHGLRTYINWSKVWEYPWLWYNILSYIDWSNIKLLDIGSEISPMPWYLASLGAQVTLVECDPQWVPIWDKLRHKTGLSVDWQIIDSEELPFNDSIYDVVTSFSVIEHQIHKEKAVSEVVRVIKNGGIFALSYDICEPEYNMTFPDWNGQALTMKDFEELFWNNVHFSDDQEIIWNRECLTDFVNWHLKSAPHHNYAVGAAWLTVSK